MTFVIEGMGLAQPSRAIAQAELAAAAAPCCCENEQQRRLLPALYRRAMVKQRHSVVVGGIDADAAAEGHGNGDGEDEDENARRRMLAFYPPARTLGDRGPALSRRMRRYPQEALPLAAAACRAALHDAAVDPASIGQLVLVSCTGFSAPGVDIGLIDVLGLPAEVGRTLVGFMGCHGAMNGLRVAGALAGSQVGDGERVLLCCVELCTLHFQYGWDPQKVVANALFADGAAAVVGCAMPGDPAELNGHASAPRIAAHGSLLLPGSRDAMTWTIRDHGFEMTLSPRVPDLIGEHLRGWLEPWLAMRGLAPRAIRGWAIHPGGPRVITAVEEAMGLDPSAGDHSRAVLRDCGNMSSPTVLFIMDRLRQADVPRPWVGLAFGPGLTIEAVLVE